MKILLFANTDWYLYNYRLPLADKLIKNGHEVVLVSPSGDYSYRILQMGYKWRALDLSRKGMNPLQEIRSIYQLVKIFNHEKPDLVHNFTIKGMLYGTFAARLVGVRKIINAVTGLGYMFSAKNLYLKIFTPVILALYYFLFKGTKVIFQNKRDMQYFTDRNLVKKGACFLIPGSGVDLSKFVPKNEIVENGLIILPGRMLWEKGVGEFVEAARIIKSENLSCRFALVGAADPGNPSSIPQDQLLEWENEGVIEWWRWQEDMVTVYQRAEIVCLPSSYYEGLSKSLIEAAACGRPLIASDIPGCREVIPDGKNGVLVPAGNAAALATTIKTLLADRPKLKEMSKHSRRIAKDLFSVESVIEETVKVYNSW